MMVNHRIIMGYLTNVVKTNAINHSFKGMGNHTIPPLNMLMTGGWFMALFYPH